MFNAFLITRVYNAVKLPDQQGSLYSYAELEDDKSLKQNLYLFVCLKSLN